MSGRRHMPQPVTATSPMFYIPVAGFLLVGLVSLLIGVVSSIWVGTLLLAIATGISIIIGYWSSRRGDVLVVALALLVFWLPFHTTASTFNFSPQELATYGICLLAAIFDRRGIRRWVKDFVATVPIAARFALVLFVLAVLQSFLRITHPDPLSIFSSLRAMILFPVGLALLVAYAIYTRKCETLLVTAFFWGGALFAVYALSLRLWGVDIANGAVAGRLGAEASFLSDYHPNNLSLYLALALAFMPAVLLAAYRSKRQRSVRFLHVLGVLGSTALMLTALWLTFSRGALAALVLAVVVMFFFFVLFGTVRQRLLSAGVLLLSVLVVGGFVLAKGVGELGRYAALLNPAELFSDPNVTFRTQLYNRALNLAMEHIYTGIGPGQFSQGASVPFSPHNTYLDLWVSIGLVGAVAFIAMLVFGLFSAMRAARRFLKSGTNIELAVMVGFAAALITFMVQAFVEAFDVEPRIAPVAWFLALAALAVWFRMAKRQRIAHPTSRKPLDDVSGEGRPDASPVLEEDDTQPIATTGGRVGRITAVLPAIERPWTLESGPMPIVEDPNDVVTDFEIPALRFWPVPTRGQLKHPIPEETTARKDTSAQRNEATSDSGAEEKESNSAESMLQRAPTSYLWNQLYSLWFFAVNFILSVIITRGLSSKEYGVYAILSTIVSMLLFLFAFGFEDVATVFLPRVLALHGQGEAGRLVRRLVFLRLLVMVAVGTVVAIGLPLAVPTLQSIGVLPHHFEQSVRGFLGLRPVLMGAYLAGSSFVTLETAFFSAVLKSRITLVVGGISQLLIVLLTVPLLKIGFGVDGIFAVQAVIAWLTAITYLFQLVPYLKARSGERITYGGEMRKLMFSAWLTNVTNGALGKQMDIMLMSLFAVSFVAIGYYNLAYQLTTIVGVLLISGLGGVGMAAMSAALAAGGNERLVSTWNASMMLQILLSVPLQVVCFVLADQVIEVLYGAQYAGAAPLLRIYLAFSIIGRFVGGGTNQGALYVIGRQKYVLMMRWSGLVLNIILDVLFIQVYGPAGALFATGFSQLWVGVMEALLIRAWIPLRYPSDFAIRVACISGLPAIILLWWTPGGFIGLAARSAVFAVLFLIGLFTFTLGDADDLTNMINANPKLRKLVNLVNRRLPRRATRRGQLVNAID